MPASIHEFPNSLTQVEIRPLGLSPEMKKLKILCREVFESLQLCEALAFEPDVYAPCLDDLSTLLEEIRVSRSRTIQTK